MNDDKLLGVAGIILKDGKILLVRRKYGADKGKWCIPCGKVDSAESLEEATIREVQEETHLVTKVAKQVHQVDKTHPTGVPYLGTWFLMQYVSGELQADDDADAADYFSLTELPELAFPDDAFVIAHCLGNT